MAGFIPLDDDPHEAARMLLPWYVTGSLDPSDRATVDAHLAGCTACRSDLEFERRVGSLVAALPIETESSWEALRRRVASHEAARASVSTIASSVPSPLLRTASRRAIAWPILAGWFVAAQAALVVLVVGMNAPVLQPALYRTLGAAPAPQVGNVIILFQAEVREADMRDLLRVNHARIVGGPTDANAYILRVAPAERARALARLQKSPFVSLAQPIDGDASP